MPSMCLSCAGRGPLHVLLPVLSLQTGLHQAVAALGCICMT